MACSRLILNTKNFPQFCYYCGMIGHSDLFCTKAAQEDRDGTGGSRNLGPQLRATVVGRRLNGYGGLPKPMARMRQEGSLQRVTPVEVLKKFQRLTVASEARASSKEALCMASRSAADSGQNSDLVIKESQPGVIFNKERGRQRKPGEGSNTTRNSFHILLFQIRCHRIRYSKAAHKGLVYWSKSWHHKGCKNRCCKRKCRSWVYYP